MNHSQVVGTQLSETQCLGCFALPSRSTWAQMPWFSYFFAFQVEYRLNLLLWCSCFSQMAKRLKSQSSKSLSVHCQAPWESQTSYCLSFATLVSLFLLYAMSCNLFDSLYPGQEACHGSLILWAIWCAALFQGSSFWHWREAWASSYYDSEQLHTEQPTGQVWSVSS